MRKVVLVVGLIAAMVVSAVGVAIAQSGDSVTASSEVSSGGTPKKPQNLKKVHYTASVDGPNDTTRADTAYRLVSKWTGLKFNSKGFATCDVDVVTTAQTDSSCPKGSLLADGRIEAIVGAATDPTSMSLCKRNVRLYNGGGGDVFVYNYGPPADCFSQTWIAPAPGTIKNKKKSNTMVFDLPIPPNIQEFIPGVKGYFSLIDVTFNNKVKEDGKTYIQGIGCGKQKNRKFTFTAYSPSDPKGISDTAKAGKC